MKRKLVTAEVLALLFTVALLWQSSSVYVERNLPAYSDYTVIAVGDSITAGYGVPEGMDYVDVLSRTLKILIRNSGVTGDTTARVLLRLQRDVLAYNPDAVIVLIGGNDFLINVPTESAFSNLRQIIDEIHSAGAAVVLVGINREFLSSYESEFEKIVREKNIAGYIPDILGGIALRPDLQFDRFDYVHPNARGHAIIAQRIAPELRRVLESLPPKD